MEAKDSFEAQQLRGSDLVSIGKIDRAEQDYVWMAKALGDGTGQEALGAFYAQTQRLDQAIATWREGLEAHADNLSLKRSLMKGLLARSRSMDIAEARQMLDDLETRLPSDAELLTLRAGLLLGEHTQAATSRADSLLERAAQVAPTYAEAHIGLIGVALLRHDYPAARKRALFALGINPADSRLLILRADGAGHEQPRDGQGPGGAGAQGTAARQPREASWSKRR